MNNASFSNFNKSAHSHNITYTPIHIKIPKNINQDKFIDNKNNSFLRENSYSVYPVYLNTYSNNTIRSNNAFSSRESKDKQYRLSKSSLKNSSITENNQDKNRKSFIFNDKYFKEKKNYKNKKNKSENDFNRFLRSTTNHNYKTEIDRYKDKGKENKFTYNFIKDTKNIHYSGVLFNEDNNNKKEYESTLLSKVIDNSKKSSSKINKSLNKSSKSKTMKKKCLTNSNLSEKMNKFENLKKSESTNRPKSSIISRKGLNLDKNLKLKLKLLDCPDSFMYYIFHFAKDKQKEENIKHKIYYSKLDMIKKFRYFKKGLEKLEQRTHFELFNLQRQIVPENELKLTKKFFSHL